VLARPTLTVLDGPGELGFLIATEPTEHAATAEGRWIDAVGAFGGAIALLALEGAWSGENGDDVPAETRGGFARVIE
jgi:hypothetical protein